jgi:hypothetical protein
LKHKINSGWSKYLHDKNHENIQLLLFDEEEIQVQIQGSRPDDKYLVSCVEGFWRCDCVDWQIQRNKREGGYCCKHIEEVHYLIADLKMSGQTKLVESDGKEDK